MSRNVAQKTQIRPVFKKEQIAPGHCHRCGCLVTAAQWSKAMSMLYNVNKTLVYSDKKKG